MKQHLAKIANKLLDQAPRFGTREDILYITKNSYINDFQKILLLHRLFLDRV